MKTLKPEALTADTFQQYGNVIDIVGHKSIDINSGNCQRYSDLADLDIDSSGAPGISIFDAKHYTSPLSVKYVERHPLGSQAFFPMNSDPFLVIVADDDNGTAMQPKVFITNGTQGVNYRRNSWHGVLTPIASKSQFVVVDYIGNENNLEEFFFETPYTVEF